MDSDMDISTPFLIVDGRKTNFSEDNCTIGSRSTPDLKKTMNMDKLTAVALLTTTKSFSMVKFVSSWSEIPDALLHILGSCLFQS
jgi:hypothetical protein